ncbi:LysR family transcriptional regulator [Paenibacillus radicis (ex Xue et al. 2023)]|uniref:LysR family transcriptional regulator n=1 Tax=Paenibacillus radicis (ex Xue et al. 2023) TaxID=2972489 RepID=A0ABT1YPE0_9BACL|nr:LysR family transcriptional regulator [Paenibacillus radicis (ex Xue et al. 2023)]MCR8635050.1 LysR family transcriptional regulator [Paenibacillus radicis (ex Xue et al. 2023)]
MIVETLKVFVTVTEQSNFSRAAELLNLSQPGVSLHIRNLEQEMGAKLMHRSPKQVKLTEAGTLLYKNAKQILSLYENAKQEIHLLQNAVTGSLKIGASFTIGEYVMPRLLAEFTSLYPQVDIQVNIGNTEEIIQAVRINELDLGLVEGHVTQFDIEAIPYMKDEMILVAPPGHPLSSLRIAEPSMLQDQVWVLRESGSGTRAFSDAFIHDAGLSVRRSYIFNSSQGVKESVAAGLGIAILSRLVVRKELEAGEIIDVPIKETSFTRDFLMIHGKKMPITMAMKMFVQKLIPSSPA